MGYSPWGHKRVGHDWVTKQRFLSFPPTTVPIFLSYTHTQTRTHRKLKCLLVLYFFRIWCIFLMSFHDLFYITSWSFPGGSEVKVSACNAGDLGSIPGSGRSPGEGNGNPLQYSCLENPMDGGAWWATVHGVLKSRTRLSNFTFTFCITDQSLTLLSFAWFLLCHYCDRLSFFYLGTVFSLKRI